MDSKFTMQNQPAGISRVFDWNGFHPMREFGRLRVRARDIRDNIAHDVWNNNVTR